MQADITTRKTQNPDGFYLTDRFSSVAADSCAIRTQPSENNDVLLTGFHLLSESINLMDLLILFNVIIVNLLKYYKL